eukprot:5254010-Ditylum_brightwellii.AAC.1
MVLYLDNKGAKNFVNNWSIGGMTQRIEVKQYFLWELKKEGILFCKWKKGREMTSDIFTKNYTRPDFEQYAAQFVGLDHYMIHPGTHKGRMLEVVNCEYPDEVASGALQQGGEPHIGKGME